MIETDRRRRDAGDRGAAVREAGLPWTSFGRYGMRASGPGVVVPMDMLRDITESGVVGDATRARVETGERIVAALVPGSSRCARKWPERSSRMTRRVIDLSQPLSRESQLHPFFPPTQILRHIHHTDAQEGRPSFTPRSSSPRTMPRPTSTLSATISRAARDSGDAARHVLRRGDLRRHPRVPARPRRDRGRG